MEKRATRSYLQDGIPRPDVAGAVRDRAAEGAAELAGVGAHLHQVVQQRLRKRQDGCKTFSVYRFCPEPVLVKR